MANLRGLALVVVVGVLGVLAALSVAFVAMAQLERRASAQRVQASKAHLLARSGIEDALARLDRGQDPDAPGNAYGGENWDGSADGKLSAFEAQEEVHRRTGAGTPADRDACPLRQAMRPSFPVLAGPDPRLITADRRQRGYSGRLAGDQGPEGNAWALRVASGQGLHVNGGDPAAPPASGYNAVLRRILGALAEAVDRQDGADDGKPVDEADGRRLVDARPSAGWASLAAIRARALGGDAAKLEALRPYLTLHSWVDRGVIAPNAVPAMAGRTYQSWARIRMDHAPSRPGSTEPGPERINGRVVGRAPVSLAWARRNPPVLIALLSGLKGLYLDESTATDWGSGNVLGTLREAEIANAWSPADDCHVAADCIRVYSGPLDTWTQWNAFCDAIPFSGTTDLRQARRDVLKAHFNPNADLNKFNPNPSLWRSVDKSELLAYSTEFSLAPVQGRMVESLGRVLGRDGRLLASRLLRAWVSAPAVARLSTQRDFACADLGDPASPGDESGVRLPGEAGFLSLNRAGGRTWGHALPGLGGTGAALQTYPEPCYDKGYGLAMNPAGYDGSLQLATVGTALDDFYAVTAATRDMKMLARFDDGFDLDVADAPAASSRACYADAEQVWTSELDHGLWDAAKPTTLCPDGAYVEEGRVPAYRDRSNCHGLRGVLSFWVKPNYRMPASNRRSHPFVMRTANVNGGANDWSSTNQFFYLGDCRPPGWNGNETTGVNFHFEIGSSPSDGNMEHHRAVPNLPGPHIWALVTAYWDFQSPNAADSGGLYLNGGAGALAGVTERYYATSGNAALGARDISQDETYTEDPALSPAPHLLSLGALDPRDAYAAFNWCFARAPDATLDEFILYDFGQDPSSAAALAMTRYKEGRYYKGSAYYQPANLGPRIGEAAHWTSPPFRLPAGAVLQKVMWTWRRPQGLPDDYAEVELLDDTGSAYLWNNDPALSRASRSRGWTRDAQAWDVALAVPGPFRARVLFLRDTPVGADTPILDSPVFDDLTLLYAPPGGSRVLGWEGGDGD